MSRFLTYGAVAACVLGVLGAAGRQQQVFRGISDTVHLFVTVTDRDSRLVTTLTRDDFDIRDEGKRQPITLFDNSPQPIQLIVMLDVSGSMQGNLPLLRAAAEQLFARLRPDDRMRIGTFGHAIAIGPSVIRDPRELRTALPDAIAPDAPTPLWRAIDEAITAFGGDGGQRRVVLVLSDGSDSGPISFPTPAARALRRRPAAATPRFRCGEDLGTAFAHMADELHSQYLIGFAPPARDGNVHDVEVRVTQRGLKPRSKESYVAPKD